MTDNGLFIRVPLADEWPEMADGELYPHLKIDVPWIRNIIHFWFVNYLKKYVKQMNFLVY